MTDMHVTAIALNIQKIQIVQNRILKTYSKDWYTHTNILHKELNLLQIQDIFSLLQMTFVRNQQQGELPEIFFGYYVTRKNIHNRANRKQIHIKKTTNIGLKSIKNCGANLYNSLPLYIKDIKSPKSFKKHMREIFLKGY